MHAGACSHSDLISIQKLIHQAYAIISPTCAWAGKRLVVIIISYIDRDRGNLLTLAQVHVNPVTLAQVHVNLVTLAQIHVNLVTLAQIHVNLVTLAQIHVNLLTANYTVTCTNTCKSIT